MISSLPQYRPQTLAYLALSLLVFGCVAVLYFTNNPAFRRFLGDLNPLLVFLAAILLGALLFAIFLSKGWFQFYTPGSLKAALPYFGVAVILGLAIILVDLKAPFPAEINVPLPQAILFYPAIGFLAEVLFHLLPLALLMLGMKAVFKNQEFERMVWVCIPLVSVFEAVFQATNRAADSSAPLWSVLYVGLHLFLISLTQLVLFKRFDFTTMYAFRLLYYLFWHILWGYYRLQIIF